MASAVPRKEEAAQSSPEVEQEQEAAVKEVPTLSLPSSACGVVSAADASSKESQPCLRSECAGQGVHRVTQASCVQPHVTAVRKYAAKGLDKLGELGEKLPLLPKPVEQILSDTKELLSARVAEVKEAVSSRVLEVLDVTRDALQGSEGAATPAETSAAGLGPAGGQRDVCGAEAVLGTAEGGSLPVGNEELAQLAVCEEGTAVPLQQHRRCFVHPGSLSQDLRLSAQLHSTARTKQLWQGMQGALAQLHCILQLAEAFKQGFNQKLQEEQEKLHQMWLDWSRKYLRESGDESPVEPEELECLTLLMARRLSQQLQLTCSGVLAALQGLPCSLQDRLQPALAASQELHAAFSRANSCQDLSSSVLSQGQRELAVIQEYMEELLDYLKNSTPLSWLVGPSSPREEEEDQSSQEEAGAAGAGHLETSSTPM
ncbi:perilipin-3-like isoform X2 [Passer montanus]|uniref:perilipin-3-like isoform X2 n=1 Tax=Passer montanus TaxID=9160 RepID=UPI0019609689|nr:perilipin-3-like isoform X2 [Passer montanus]XP_039584112.1 perilipin-3-like isoform X2 [Passer montanus]